MIMEGFNDSSITANMKTTPVLILCVVALINTGENIIVIKLIQIAFAFIMLPLFEFNGITIICIFRFSQCNNRWGAS